MGRIPEIALAAALILLFATAVRAEDAPVDTLIDFQIKDQFERLHTHARFRGRPLLVTWGDRKGSEFMDQWSPVLDDSLAVELKRYRLRHLEVAHVKGVPFFIKGKVKDAFPKDPEAFVLMDWDGVFAKAYQLTADHANVLLFDIEGRLVKKWAVTVVDPEILAEILASARALAE